MRDPIEELLCACEIIDDEGVIIRLSDEELAAWRERLSPIQEEFRDTIDAELIETAIEANANADPFGSQ